MDETKITASKQNLVEETDQLLCTQATMELEVLQQSKLPNWLKESMAEKELRDLEQGLSYMGKDVGVLAAFYMVWHEGRGYSLHTESRVIAGKALGLRYDPGIMIGDDKWASALSLQLVVEDRNGIRKLVPLALPVDVVALSIN